MKTFKKIEFNSCKHNKEETKDIQEKHYGGYAYIHNTSSDNTYSCFLPLSTTWLLMEYD